MSGDSGASNRQMGEVEALGAEVWPKPATDLVMELYVTLCTSLKRRGRAGALIQLHEHLQESFEVSRAFVHSPVAGGIKILEFAMLNCEALTCQDAHQALVKDSDNVWLHACFDVVNKMMAYHHLHAEAEEAAITRPVQQPLLVDLTLSEDVEQPELVDLTLLDDAEEAEFDEPEAEQVPENSITHDHQYFRQQPDHSGAASEEELTSTSDSPEIVLKNPEVVLKKKVAESASNEKLGLASDSGVCSLVPLPEDSDSELDIDEKADPDLECITQLLSELVCKAEKKIEEEAAAQPLAKEVVDPADPQAESQESDEKAVQMSKSSKSAFNNDNLLCCHQQPDTGESMKSSATVQSVLQADANLALHFGHQLAEQKEKKERLTFQIIGPDGELEPELIPFSPSDVLFMHVSDEETEEDKSAAEEVESDDPGEHEMSADGDQEDGSTLNSSYDDQFEQVSADPDDGSTLDSSSEADPLEQLSAANSDQEDGSTSDSSSDAGHWVLAEETKGNQRSGPVLRSRKRKGVQDMTTPAAKRQALVQQAPVVTGRRATKRSTPVRMAAKQAQIKWRRFLQEGSL